MRMPFYNSTKYLKRASALFAVCSLTVCLSAFGTASKYENNNNFAAPPATIPQIDATNFINNAPFYVGANIFDFSSVQNFTNRNSMSGPSVFVFDTAPTESGVRHAAANFVNANSVNSNLNNAVITAGLEILVSATNVINRGTLNALSSSGIIRIQGDNVDLSRGTLIGGAASGISIGVGDRYWGYGTNQFDPLVNFAAVSPFTPSHEVTQLVPGATANQGTNGFQTFNTALFFSNPGLQGFEVVTNSGAGGSNQTVQIVFLRNANTNIPSRVLFSGNTPTRLGIPRIEWSLASTNVFGTVITNYLYVTDNYGVLPTNSFITNFSGAGAYTLRPQNFSVFASQTPVVPFGAITGAPPYMTHTASFWSTNMPPLTLSNSFSAYGVSIFNTSVNPATTPGPPNRTLLERLRAFPGRMEITANKTLDLSLTRVQNVNYMMISGTNHFKGSSNAIISTPYMDAFLQSTNGTLTVSNLVQPIIRRFSGEINLYSAVWTNDIVIGTATNATPVLFHVLFVDARLSDQSPSTILDLALHVGGQTSGPGSVGIGDSFNVIGHFSLDGTNDLTISGNNTLSLTPEDSQDGDWAGNVTYLRAFTNNGALSGANTFYFFGRGLGPDGGDLPYQQFVNRGAITNNGTIISADYLENSGTIVSRSGPIFIQASNVFLLASGPTNQGLLSALGSDITINASTLSISNQVIRLARSLSLSVTDNIRDGEPAATNKILVNDGFNLYVKPATGDLRYTVVTNKALSYANIINSWAGEDRGPTTAGFTNNVALGKLILSGGANSLFTFKPVGANNALYVGTLELVGSAALTDGSGNLTGVSVLPGMKIYYTNLRIDGAPASASLIDGKNGGAFSMVSGYSGPADLLLPADETVATEFSVDLDVLPANSPGSAVMVSWNTLAGSTNYLYYKSSLSDPEWHLLNSFISSGDGRASVPDAVSGEGRFYKVRVDLPNP